MKYAFYTTDVFTDRIFGGNPLAVFPEAQGLTDALMQQIAREVNYSESVFVFPPDDAAHTRRLRIFTPGGELPFAGHPTLGAAHVLAAADAVPLTGDTTRIVFEEGVGPVAVTLTARDGAPDFAQLTAAQAPEFGPEPPGVEALAALLSLDVDDLSSDEFAPQAVSCGVPFLFVPVRDHEALGRIALQREAWNRTLSGFWAPHVYALVPADGDGPMRARMFAPAMDIEEDPATGAAASALAGYLGSRDGRADGALRWVVEQGVEMGRPSRLHVEADKQGGRIVAVRVGGRSVLVSEGTMRVPGEEASWPTA